jgi:tetratricopeptide (TPR) repeat protein
MSRDHGLARSDPADLPPVQRIRWIALRLLWVLLGLMWVIGIRFAPQTVLGESTDDPAANTLRVFIATTVSILLVALAIHAHWRAQLERLAYLPGPLLIFPVVDWRTSREDQSSGNDATRVESARGEAIRADLQRLLVETEMHGPTAIPSPGRSSDFLQVIEDASGQVEGFGGALFKFVRLLSPRSSYEVRCSILEPQVVGGGKHSSDCVLQVELTRAPKYVLAPETIISATWEEATSAAAAWIAAMVLPRTRKCKIAPWTLWQNLKLPPALFSHFQQFRVHLDRGLYPSDDAPPQEECYDSALAALERALALDPLNLALRLEKGKLLELKGKYLAALETYDSIISQAARRSKRLAYLRFGPPAIDGSDSDSAVSRRWYDKRRARGLPARHPIVYVARYRYALLLSLGEELSREWWLEDGRAAPRSGPEVGDDPPALRRSLAGRMMTAYAEPIARIQSAFGSIDDISIDPREFLAAGTDEHPSADELTRRRLGAWLFFTSVGIWEVEHLLTERSRFGTLNGASRENLEIVPNRSLELLLPRAILRRAMIFIEDAGNPLRNRNECAAKAAGSMLFPIDEPIMEPGLDGLLGEGWPSDVRKLRSWIQTKRGRAFGSLRSWHEHYNAACVIAVLLQRNLSGGSDARDGVIDAAVTELEKAVACGDSGYLASKSGWILLADPDLAELRDSQRFEDFRVSILGRAPQIPDRQTLASLRPA